MSHTIKLKKGFDINLAGKAEHKISNAPKPETFAIKQLTSRPFLGQSYW